MLSGKSTLNWIYDIQSQVLDHKYKILNILFVAVHSTWGYKSGYVDIHLCVRKRSDHRNRSIDPLAQEISEAHRTPQYPIVEEEN